MHFHFIDVLLLYYGHKHVSASHVTVFRVISLRTRIPDFYMLLTVHFSNI